MEAGPEVGVVVLSAGASRRMAGGPKALLSIHGAPMVQQVVARARAAGVSEAVVAIAPPHGEWIRTEWGQTPAAAGVLWAWNANPELGMLSSVQCALPLLSSRVEGALVWPVDIPLVAVSTVGAVIGAGKGSAGALVVPTWQGRGGHPLWLPRTLFAEALALAPALGLRALRERHPVVRLPVEDEAILRDVDTPEELQAAVARSG